MTLSRMTILALLLAQAAPLTAEEAVSAYRHVLKPIAQLDCPGAEGDEVVVCGRRRDRADPYRLPLPGEGGAGNLKGESTSGTAAMGAGGCLRLCPSQVGITFNTRDGGSAARLAEAVKRMLGKD